MARVVVKRRYAVMLEDAVEVEASDDIADLQAWAKENFEELFVTAFERESLGPDAAALPRLLWEDLHVAWPTSIPRLAM